MKPLIGLMGLPVDDDPEELARLRLLIALSAWEAIPNKESLIHYDDPLVAALRNIGEENRRLRNLHYLSGLKVKSRRKNAAKPKPAPKPKGRPRKYNYEKWKDLPCLVEECKALIGVKSDKDALLWLLQNGSKMNGIRAGKEVKKYQSILYRVRNSLNYKE